MPFKASRALPPPSRFNFVLCVCLRACVRVCALVSAHAYATCFVCLRFALELALWAVLSLPEEGRTLSQGPLQAQALLRLSHLCSPGSIIFNFPFL